MEDLKTTSTLIWSDRWRLGALSKNELMNIGFVSVIIGFLFVLFHLLGNTVENVGSRSAFTWMIARWGDKESFGADYSHGYLIPFVSLAVIWHKREEFFEAPKQICQAGLYLIIAALVMHWVGAKMQQTRISFDQSHSFDLGHAAVLFRMESRQVVDLSLCIFDFLYSVELSGCAIGTAATYCDYGRPCRDSGFGNRVSACGYHVAIALF